MPKKPKYGYARNYFGNIVRSDEYFEEHPQGADRSYQGNEGMADYEDDHDNFYDSDSWE